MAESKYMVGRAKRHAVKTNQAKRKAGVKTKRKGHTEEHKKNISEGLKRYHANKKGKNWIKGAIKHPGALTKKAAKLGLTKKDGKLKAGAAKKLEKSKNPTTRKEAQLAVTLGKLRNKAKQAKSDKAYRVVRDRRPNW